MSVVIRVESLIKNFPGVRAVDGVTFKTEDGQVFGLLGPNGAGKTTTIRLILSILKPDSGRIFVGDVDVLKDGAKARSMIGAVLEDNGLYDRLTAFENVAIFGEMYGLDRTTLKERIERLFELLELKDVRNKKAGSFSKGMKQKVAVARALVADPPVLILDEPTSGLDVLTKRTILDLMKEEKKRGKSILYSTHIMSEAEEICDVIAIIHHGRIRAIGALQELHKQTGKEKLEDIFIEIVREPYEPS